MGGRKKGKRGGKHTVAGTDGGGELWYLQVQFDVESGLVMEIDPKGQVGLGKDGKLDIGR